ncbi:pyridoxal phosphate-dependent decarboxylase family protein [Xanthovirga aplysinae]|uniref:pyridoxal phosphate-dependent decarboxylase family protein n=1 Tax=Xanthovirga aplysinae TaxID=2529853 RepID=UPI0012BC9E16|nr:aspartate aminotransferase family protein [Xanthovirga aplysinae]MTI33269.1 decarboxylase [Xanthovirga aplysinae]
MTIINSTLTPASPTRKGLGFPFLFHNSGVNQKIYKNYMHMAVGHVLNFLENRDTPFSGVQPEELKKRFDLIDLDNSQQNVDFEKVLEEVKDLYLDHAVAFHHPKYIAHLNCPILTPAIAAEVLISSVNSSLDTWDQSAGGTLIEQKLIRWTCDLIGYKDQADGIFTSGGTQSNLMALLMARDQFCQEKLGVNIKIDGLPPEASRFRIFTSENSHFSIKKNAAVLGLGHKSVIGVPVDNQFRMSTSALEEAIKEELNKGNIPIAVIGTAGTTDFGSIDPLEKIASIASKYQLWFHTDAAVGGALLMSSTQASRLKGIEHSDSVTIDYHKTFFQPVSCSGFLFKNKDAARYICYHADYLNSKEQEKQGLPNNVNKSLQTTKRFDALKLWMTLRTLGREMLSKHYEYTLLLSKQAAHLIGKDPAFELLHQPELNCLVFRFNPGSNLNEEQLNVLNLNIRQSLFKEGKVIIASTKVRGTTYLKFTILNPLMTIKDFHFILNQIKQHADLHQ